MVQKLFARGFAVVAPAEQPNAPGGCWVPTIDTAPVYAAMTQFLNTRGLNQLPLYGIGLSSGGGMAVSLAAAGLPFAGLHLNSSPGGAKKDNPGYFSKRIKWPPVSFVYMPADTYAAPDDIRTAETALTVMQAPVQVLEVQPKPIEELAERVDRAGILGPGAGAKLVQQLQTWGLVESRYGQNFMVMSSADQALSRLILDPVWGPQVKKVSKAVYEELHLVEGVHGPTVEDFDTSLDFLTGASQNAAQPAPAAAAAPPVAPPPVAAQPFLAASAVPSQQAQQPPSAALPATATPVAAPAIVAPAQGAPAVTAPAPFAPSATVPMPAAPAVVAAAAPTAVVPVAAAEVAPAVSAPVPPQSAVPSVPAVVAPATSSSSMSCGARHARTDGSEAQRVLSLSKGALAGLEAHHAQLSPFVNFLCTCLKVRISERPTTQTAEAAVTFLNGQTIAMPDEGRSADSPDVDLRAAKVILCHGEAQSECQQCASWDPFVRPRKKL